MFGGVMDYIQSLIGGGDSGNAGVGLLPGKSLNVGLNPNARGGMAGLMPGDLPDVMGKGGGLPGLLGRINIPQLMSRGGMGGAGGGLGAALGGLGGLGGLGVQMMKNSQQQPGAMPTPAAPIISMMRGPMQQQIQELIKRYRGGM